MPRMTRSEHAARRRLMYHLWRSDEDILPMRALREEVPEAWHMIEADIDCFEPKVKTTLYLDASVAKMFRAMGKGYQARINRILGTWLALKMTGLMEEDVALNNRRGRLMEAEKQTGKYPGWGPGLREPD